MKAGNMSLAVPWTPTLPGLAGDLKLPVERGEKRQKVHGKEGRSDFAKRT